MIFAMEDAAALTEAGSSTELFFDDGVVAAAGGAFLGVSLPGFIFYATVVGIKQNVWGTLQEQLVECRSSARRSIVSDATRFSHLYPDGFKYQNHLTKDWGFITRETGTSLRDGPGRKGAGIIESHHQESPLRSIKLIIQSTTGNLDCNAFIPKTTT
jgi:hypothetical protein